MAKNNETTICGVCGLPILEKDPFPYLDNTYRHRKCGPGTKAWTAKHGLSKIGELLQKKVKDPAVKKSRVVKKDSICSAIRELCGRIKYMTYMDSVNKNLVCDWCIETTINGKVIKFHKSQGVIDPDLLYQQVMKGATNAK